MINFENDWCLHFVTECYFDTVLVKNLMQTEKRLMHRKGCNNVVNDLDSNRMIDKFGVAIIDKDKIKLNYLKNCEVLYDENKLKLWKHKNRLQFVIQLNPPLEKWIIELMKENNLNIEDFGYSPNYKILKKQIKNDIDNEKDVKLNNLVKAIISMDNDSIKKLGSVLNYLKNQNYEVDLNELRNV